MGRDMSFVVDDVKGEAELRAAPRSAAPRLSKGAIERARLLLRLVAARHHACVLLQGPAGSGKTTLALQWRGQLQPYGFDFAWMTVHPNEDAEPVIDNLFASLDRIDPCLAREAKIVHNRDGEALSHEAVAIALIRGFAQHPGELLLLLDDYHLVADLRVHRLVQMLLDLAPPNFHLVIASRSVPPLSLARLRDKGALFELDFRDLRFSFEEVEQLLRTLGPEHSRRDARMLHDMTGGWIAGLRLVVLAPVAEPAASGSGLRLPVQNAHEFAAYFNREVLAKLSREQLDRMSILAAARRFDGALCDHLFGAEHGQALMERLRRDNLFMIPFEDGEREGWQRFHPLFRELLQERFERLPANQRQTTHAALGEWFGRRRQLRDAVHHCVAAGDVDRAADWIERDARQLFLDGELRTLVRAVEELSRSVLMQRLSLRLWVAWAQLCYRRLDDCRASLESLTAMLPGPRGEAADNESTRHALTLLEGSLAIQCDDSVAGERLMPTLLAIAHSNDAIVVGGRRNMLGWLYTQLGRFDDARSVLAGPRPRLEDGSPLLDSAFGALTAKCLLGYSHLHEGDCRLAEHLLRETLVESERTLGAWSEPACNAAAFLARLLYEVNDIDGVHALLDDRVEAIERVGLPDALICAAIARSRVQAASGHAQDALAELDRLEELAQRRSLDRALAFALVSRMELHLSSGAHEAAEDALTQLRMLSRRPTHPGSAATRKAQGLAAWARVRWLCAVGRHNEARDALVALMGDAPFVGEQRSSAQWTAQLAMIDAALGRRAEALDGIAEALAASQRLDLVRTLLDLGPGFLQLGEEALASGRLDGSLAFRLEQLKAHAARQHAAQVTPTLSHGTAVALSERELEIVRALATALPNKRIGLALGISAETVKWHLKNVYAKLGVYGRDGAVMRARDLGFLAAASDSPVA